MKKTFSALFTGMLVSAAFSTFAQQDTYAANVNPVAFITNYPPRTELKASEVNSNALENFTRNNKAVSNVTWTSSGTVLSVYFEKDGIKSRSTYDEKGKWEYTLRYLSAKQAPYRVREAIDTYCPGKTIVQVTEIKKTGSVYHLVKLEDATSYLTVQVMNGEVDLVEKVTR
ncbi:MAG: hypothetical protein JNK79_08295 [Chitinophagaceae bacterium]|nr:hypothetical protein [Chitinophagaceae bacterium]